MWLPAQQSHYWTENSSSLSDHDDHRHTLGLVCLERGGREGGREEGGRKGGGRSGGEGGREEGKGWGMGDEKLITH